MGLEKDKIRQAARHLLLVNGVISVDAKELTANDLATCPVSLADRHITSQIVRQLSDWPDISDDDRCGLVLRVAEGIGISTDCWSDTTRVLRQLLMRCTAKFLIGIWEQAKNLTLTQNVAEALAKSGRNDLDRDDLLSLIREIQWCTHDNTEATLIDALVANAGCTKSELMKLFGEKATPETKSPLVKVDPGNGFGPPILERLRDHHNMSVTEWLGLFAQAADSKSRWIINRVLLGDLNGKVATIAEVVVPKKTKTA